MPDSDPLLGVDAAEVAEDDQIVERLRAGQVPATAAFGPTLAAWRAEIYASPTPIFAALVELYRLDLPAEIPAEVRDVADLNDSTAPDPTPDEITHPGHPDYVLPWTG